MAFWAPEGNFNLWYLPKQVSLQSQTAHDSSPTIIGNMTAKWLNLGNFLFFPNWNPRIGVWGLKCFSSFRIISVFLSNLSESAQWSEVRVTQSCLILCDPLDCTVHGILQARILEWVAYRFSRGSSQPRDQDLLSICHLSGPLNFCMAWSCS